MNECYFLIFKDVIVKLHSPPIYSTSTNQIYKYIYYLREKKSYVNTTVYTDDCQISNIFTINNKKAIDTLYSYSHLNHLFHFLFKYRDLILT